jgi:hypothetical protein
MKAFFLLAPVRRTLLGAPQPSRIRLMASGLRAPTPPDAALRAARDEHPQAFV